VVSSDSAVGEEDPPAAEQVAGATAEQQQPTKDEGVGVQHPRQTGRGEAERPMDVRQRDVHDRRIEHDHQLRSRDDGESEVGVSCRGLAAGVGG